jgi:hypothetical protein
MAPGAVEAARQTTGSIRGVVLDIPNGTGDGNRVGAEVDFRMRDGSRERAQSLLSVSAIDASGVVEGPLGGPKRGSWLFSARRRNARVAPPDVNRETFIVAGLYETMVPLIPALGVLLEL